MKAALRCAVVLAVSVLLAGQSLVPYDESGTGRESCLATHQHHSTWLHSDSADPAAGRNSLCCHLQSSLRLATFQSGLQQTVVLAPVSLVRRSSTDRLPKSFLSVLVPPG